jgi:hypothetical protein
MKYLAYLNILFGDNHVQNSGNCKKGGCPEAHLGIKNRIKKIQLFFISQTKKLAKGWVCDNFPRQFHFFLGAIHEKHKFKYFKNLTVKVCKIWCNDVYMSIL